MSAKGPAPDGPSPEERVNIWESRFPAQKCSAHKASTGAPCQAWAISGGAVCVYHGGRAPAVREAARRRLDALVPLALDVLAELTVGRAHDPGSDAPMAVPPGVRARACAEILARAGVAAVTEIDVPALDARPDLDSAILKALAARGLAAPATDGPATGTGDTDQP